MRRHEGNRVQRAVTPGERTSPQAETDRLSEALQQRDDLLELTARLAFGLLAQHELDDTIDTALAELGKGTGVDRVYLFENRPPSGSGSLLCDQRYEWVDEGIEPQIGNPDLQGLDIGALFPRGLESLSRGLAYGGLVESFDASERAILDPQGIKSLLIVPIFIEDRFWGFVGFDAVRTVRRWLPVEEGVLKVVAAALGAAIERRRAEADLRRAVSVFESTRDAIAVADLEGLIVSANPALTLSSGYEREELIGQPWTMMFADEAQRLVHAPEIDAALSEQGYWRGECQSQRRNGEWYPQWLSVNVVRNNRGQPAQYVIVATDISPLKASEARFDHLAHHDMLTGLPNRRRAQQTLEHAIEYSRGRGDMIAVLFLDLDRFKGVNDSLGHAAGDELLVEAVRRLRARLRGEDQLARLGGDEFLVVLERLGSAEEAVAVAHDLCARLREPYRIADGEVFATASIGISLFPGHADTAEGLIQRADMAMYHAKQEGRDQVQVFNDQLGAAAREALTLEGILRRALEKDGLRLHYQPRIDLASGRINGAEALLRIDDGAGGSIPAGQVIALAERIGLIVPIGRWVLFEACRQLAQWRADDLPPITVAVNVSARQFYSDNLPQTVQEALAGHALPASALEIELTESVLLHRPEEAVEVLSQLSDLGISSALDDFGTGYSSLSYLMRFPVDRLKIDHEFVSDLPRSPRASAIASTMVELAHRLGLRIVAEGVETQDQLDFLKAEGFDEAQGFLFGRPLPPDTLAALLREGR